MCNLGWSAGYHQTSALSAGIIRAMLPSPPPPPLQSLHWCILRREIWKRWIKRGRKSPHMSLLVISGETWRGLLLVKSSDSSALIPRSVLRYPSLGIGWKYCVDTCQHQHQHQQPDMSRHTASSFSSHSHWTRLIQTIFVIAYQLKWSWSGSWWANLDVRQRHDDKPPFSLSCSSGLARVRTAVAGRAAAE